MSVLDWLDPTRTWPVVAGPAPDVNRTSMQLDALRFGAPIESAHVLGKPEKFHWNNRLKKECELLYARKGLRLRFGDGRLREVTFLIGPESSDHPDFTPAQPTAPDGTRLNAQTTRDRIEALFGPADPGGSDETTLQIFHRNGVASDFDLDQQGQLIEWSIYPED
jgi:hypothetical protein